MTDRTYLDYWDDPIFSGLEYYRWYNPVLWGYILLTILVLTKWWAWHKWQSLTARRSRISLEMWIVLTDLQSAHKALEDCDCGCDRCRNRIEYAKHQLQDVDENMEGIAEQLSLKDTHFDGYWDQE